MELRHIRIAHERVLHYLRYLPHINSQTYIVFDRSMKDIAVALGLAHETLFGALRRLEREGRITRTPAQIQLKVVLR